MNNVLIYRPDNIGDVLLFSGALRHIRDLYPDAHITLAVQPHIVNLVELCPYIDLCMPVNRLTWWDRIKAASVSFPPILEQVINELDRVRNSVRKVFDIIIFPVKSPDLSFLSIVRILNVKKSFGITGCNLNTPQGGFPAGFRPEQLFSDCLDVSGYDPWRHELLTTLDFLQFLGCRVSTPDDILPQFWLSDTEFDHLSEIKTTGRKIIGLFPGASFEGRCWESANYGELARLIGGNPVYAIFGGPDEIKLAQQVESTIRAAGKEIDITNLVGKTTLRELAKSIASCDLFIGMETSGLHMAITAKVPTIGIIGGGHYGRFAPWGESEKSIFMTKKMECFYCNWLCQRDRTECIQGVTPQEVANSVNKLLYS